MRDTPIANGLDLFAALLRLEQVVLSADSLAETRFIIANETRKLAPYIQAVLLTGNEDEPLQVQALSSISDVDRTTPFSAWIERLAKHVSTAMPGSTVTALTADHLTPDLRREWPDFAAAHLLWLPMYVREGHRQGVLLLSRESSWSAPEQALLTHLACIYAFALQRFKSGHRLHWQQRKTQKIAALSALLLAGASFFPVKLSVLSPAEITPRDAFVVAAPIDGVVTGIQVLPNQLVSVGAVLAELESTDLKGIQDIAARTLDVTQAELRRAQQASFVDPARKADLAQLQAQVDLKQREYQLAQSRRQKATLNSDRSGVAVVDDPQAWKGRPVRVGERIMSIADPTKVEVTVMVPVKDAIVLEPGNEVRVFLDTNPLQSLPGTVQYVVYESTLSGEWPAYKVRATLDASVAAPRIGLRGTARIYGDDTTLFYYLLRRPITAARQWMGW
jgi:multidrug resistance efflux pump